MDKKPLAQWYQRTPGVESLCLDLSEEDNCRTAVEGAAEVYNLAADMGGMGFIERHRVECLRSVLINTHLIESAWQAGAQRYFFSSSACAYNTDLQKDPKVRALKESDAYPAMARARLRLGEAHIGDVLPGVQRRTRLCNFHRALPQRVRALSAPGTAAGERRRRPSAARSSRQRTATRRRSLIWGDGTQTRSFMYIDDCTKGIDKIMHCDSLRATPINLGSSELVSINELVSMVETIGGVKLTRRYDPTAPRGVAGRNSDNTMIHKILGWEPDTPLKDGLAKTYRWIEQQYSDRKTGKPTVS